MNKTGFFITFLIVALAGQSYITYNMSTRLVSLETKVTKLEQNRAVQVGDKLNSFLDEINK